MITLRHGLIDKKGNILIPIDYLYMESMDNSGKYFRVVNIESYKSGVLDNHNTIVVPFEYDFIQATPDPDVRIKTKYGEFYPDHIEQVKVCIGDLFGIYDIKLQKEIIKP